LDVLSLINYNPLLDIRGKIIVFRTNSLRANRSKLRKIYFINIEKMALHNYLK